jgi:hypothetical protein
LSSDRLGLFKHHQTTRYRLCLLIARLGFLRSHKKLAVPSSSSDQSRKDSLQALSSDRLGLLWSHVKSLDFGPLELSSVIKDDQLHALSSDRWASFSHETDLLRVLS